ncbi:YqcC family protein [Marinomonas algarum]|uniref:YqcC family protein n=1 Tax=Marinomonas algarum TaxID=2883105 RepID=A0A9X1INY0_9GAMM|nr:YqcC family protein [Marinomonas algarum]MCB5162753.1 YqcC family protein [Marinomonas algarum]
MKAVFSDQPTLADLLADLQGAMQEASVWECTAPSDIALQSQEPFCIDTMSFPQWLRFVMITRFKLILVCGQDLPASCHISPMAEEAFKSLPSGQRQAIVYCLDRIDQHLSSSQ